MTILTKAKDKLSDLAVPNGRNAGITRKQAIIAFAATTAAAIATRELLESGWRRTQDRDPPKNPESSEVTWKEALVLGTVSGALAGIIRIVARRVSNGALRRYRA